MRSMGLAASKLCMPALLMACTFATSFIRAPGVTRWTASGASLSRASCRCHLTLGTRWQSDVFQLKTDATSLRSLISPSTASAVPTHLQQGMMIMLHSCATILTTQNYRRVTGIIPVVHAQAGVSGVMRRPVQLGGRSPLAGWSQERRAELAQHRGLPDPPARRARAPPETGHLLPRLQRVMRQVSSPPDVGPGETSAL